MKKITLTLLLAMMGQFSTFAQQIIVNPSTQSESQLDLATLIEQVFFSSSQAVTVSNVFTTSYDNVQYTDQNFNTLNGKSYAYFEHDGGNFPLNRGIILSNGAATVSAGPNTLDPLSGLGSGSVWAGDADVKTLLDARFGDNQPTMNATIVEFDFVTLDDVISFDYVYASDEYVNGPNGGTSYECSTFQDGFAFLLTGLGVPHDPGLSGKNLAVLPGNIPVSTGTIHNNSAMCPAQHPAMYVNHGGAAAATAPINYNGRTTLLTMTHPVVAGETYHMKIVIADRTDNSVDSAVFLGGVKHVDLEEDRALCTGSSTVLEAKGSFINPTYKWYLNGTEVPGAMAATLTVNQVGDYMVQVTESNRVSKDYIKVYEFQSSINTLQDLELQDDNNDQTMVFDLTQQNAQLFSTSVNNVQVSYHETQADANAGVNPIANPNAYSNVSNPQAIYVRIVQNEAVSCVTTQSFNLKVGNAMSVPEEVTAANALIVRYNKESNEIVILDKKAFEITSCKLYNLLGQEIVQFGSLKSTNNQITLDANVANNGIYLLNFNYKDKVPVKRKIMIK